MPGLDIHTVDLLMDRNTAGSRMSTWTTVTQNFRDGPRATDFFGLSAYYLKTLKNLMKKGIICMFFTLSSLYGSTGLSISNYIVAISTLYVDSCVCIRIMTRFKYKIFGLLSSIKSTTKMTICYPFLCNDFCLIYAIRQWAYVTIVCGILWTRAQAQMLNQFIIYPN